MLSSGMVHGALLKKFLVAVKHFLLTVGCYLQAHLYGQIEAAGITYISIGHRKTLYSYHKRVLHISKFDSRNNGECNWQVEPIKMPVKSFDETSPTP